MKYTPIGYLFQPTKRTNKRKLWFFSWGVRVLWIYGICLIASKNRPIGQLTVRGQPRSRQYKIPSDGLDTVQ